jgi:AraC-like DNA-binding protein
LIEESFYKTLYSQAQLEETLMQKEKIEKYHLLKNEPKKRQFDLFNLAEYKKTSCIQLSKPHTHSFYQIIWFKNNIGKHYIDFESYDIKENRLFFVAKNQVHYYENRPDYKGYSIHFNESFILSNETDINFFLTYHIFNTNEDPYFQIPKRLENQIERFFAQMEDELNNTEEFGNERILSNLLKSLLLVVEREERKNTKSSNVISNDKATYLCFRDLLENNFYKNWPVSNYADELAVSTKTLNARIKKQTGKTVSQIIADRIILEAKRKLTHTNSYINEIAFDLGFQDPYYFIKYFKKHVSHSPTEFRKSIS